MSEALAVRGDGVRLKSSGVTIVSLRVVGTIPGVVVEAAGGRNGPGAGRLKSGASGLTLAWQAPGSSTYGSESDVVDGGTYLLEDGEDPSCWVRVRVYADFLTPGPAEARVFLGDCYNGLGPDDVSAAEALAGLTETTELSLANDSAGVIYNLKLWIDAISENTLFVSTDGVNFFQPYSELDGNVLCWFPLVAGSSVSVWVRRVIPPASAFDPGLLNLLQWRWDVLL